MLLRAWTLEGELLKLRLSSGKMINFYVLIPLYPDELKFKKENSAEKLLDRLIQSYDVDFPIVDVHRKSVVENEEEIREK